MLATLRVLFLVMPSGIDGTFLQRPLQISLQNPSAHRMFADWWGSQDALRSCKDKEGFLANLTYGLQSDRLSLINRAFANQNNTVVTLVSTRHILCILDNWFVHAEKALGSQVPVVVIALDSEAQNFCTRQHGIITMRLTCVDFSGWMPDIGEGNVGKKNSNAGFGSCIYQMIVWTKPFFLMHAANVSRYGVFMVDSDVIMLGNLVSWLKDFNANLMKHQVLITGQEGNAGWNTGTVFATRASVAVIEKWLNFAPLTGRSLSADQAGFFKLMEQYADHKVPYPLAVIPKQVVGECGHHSKTDLAVHFNCKHDKIAAMRLAGLWKPLSPECGENL